jgi:hypothetical protein
MAWYLHVNGKQNTVDGGFTISCLLSAIIYCFDQTVQHFTYCFGVIHHLSIVTDVLQVFGENKKIFKFFQRRFTDIVETDFFTFSFTFKSLGATLAGTETAARRI